MNRLLRTALALSTVCFAAQAAAQITFYQGEGFRGRAFSTAKPVADFGRNGFDNRASSVVVDTGRWEVCGDARFRGRCVVLRKGSYESLQKLGMQDMISSVRPANSRRRYDNEAEAQMDKPNYAWRRRANEQVYEAPVTSVRAVMGPPTQRCWTERDQVRGQDANAAALAAVISSVLGHSVGSDGTMRNSQRCESTVSGTPDHWDVTYQFRGRDHVAQMTAPPGRTIFVNRAGEPRQ